MRKEPGKLALWLVLGVIGMLVCLVGGGIGFGGAMFSAFEHTDREARAAVSEYLDALRQEEYADAYRLTCRPHREEVPEAEFVAARRDEGALRGYRLGTITDPGASAPPGAYAVPATLNFVDGTESHREFVVVRERVSRPTSGEPASDDEFAFRVCGAQPAPAPRPT